MSNANTPAETNAKCPHELSALQKEWCWFLALGAALVVTGTIAIIAPLASSLVTIAFIGILLLIGGTVQIVSSFWSGQWSGFLLHLLIGILYLVVGAMIMRNPVQGLAGVTLLMAAFFIVSGIFKIIVSLQLRFHNWGWPLLNGIVTLILGLIIWSRFPESALWIIGLFVGIEMLFNGWAWVMFSLDLKNAPAEA